MRLIAPLFLIACGSKNSDVAVEADPVSDATIRKVTFNQGVSIVLEDALYGVPSGQHDVIVGRDGLVSVQIDVDNATWETRDVRAILEVSSVPEPLRLESLLRIDADSRESERETMFEFLVPGHAVGPGMQFDVRLVEATSAAAGDPANEGARFTSSDAPEWGYIRTGPLTIRLIPVAYNADGSGRMPDTSPEQLQIYAGKLRTLYPASEIRVELGSALQWNEAISPSGQGWETILSEIAAMRAAATDVPENTYFYGLFNPAVSEAEFCALGCVLGLSNLGTESESELRSSVGLGYSGLSSADTLVHELGHAHGRLHAPCGGAQGVDPEFPNGGAGIGGWGWNIDTNELVSSTEGKDLMGYCSPVWVSGYTWQAFAERISVLDSPATMARFEGLPRSWQRYAVELDGSVIPIGFPTERTREPIGEPLKVRVTDADGSHIEVARWFPSSHLESGMLLLETTDPDAKVELLD